MTASERIRQRREAYDFFREHAGYIVGENAQGALELARAEQEVENRGWTFDWQEEEDLLTATGEQIARFESGETVYLYCLCLDANGEVLASLGGIEIKPPTWHTDDPYVRVVQAELALEAQAH